MADIFTHYAVTFLSGILLPTFKVLLPAAAVGSVLEVLFRANPHSWKSRLRGAGFWLVYIVLGLSLTHLAEKTSSIYGLTPLFSIDLSAAIKSNNVPTLLLGYLVFPFGAVFVYDFFYYWFHRLQHATPLLWRFHAVHHAIEELNAVNNYHHWTEMLWRLPFIALPLALLVKIDVPQVTIILTLIGLAGHVTHANTRASYGPLKWLFVEPRYHRVHHSIAAEHWDRNFAFYFPVWDMLFATAYFPKPSEYPATGLADRRECRTLKDYLLAGTHQLSGNCTVEGVKLPL